MSLTNYSEGIMENDNEYFRKIIIAPFKGEIKVSEEKNTVMIDGVKKLRGYAMTGRWCVESEDVGKTNGWCWRGAVHSAIGKAAEVLLAMETIHTLCFLLRRSGVKYAVLTPAADGRYHFLKAYDAGISYDRNALFPRELVFVGALPYPTTFYNGEVEVAGDAVPELLNYLYEKKYKEE